MSPVFNICHQQKVIFFETHNFNSNFVTDKLFENRKQDVADFHGHSKKCNCINTFDQGSEEHTDVLGHVFRCTRTKQSGVQNLDNGP